MTWQFVARVELSRYWQLTPLITGSLFRIRHTTASRIQNYVKAVLTQALVSDSNELTIFDSRRLAYKLEVEAFLFVQPSGGVKRSLAVKRLDDAIDPWIIEIEVLKGEGMSEINLPIDISDVSGLELALLNKAEVAALDAHIRDTGNPHATNAMTIGAEPAGTAMQLFKEHLATVDPHLINAIHVDYEPDSSSLLTALNAQSALDQLAALLEQLQTQVRNITLSEKPSLVVDPFVNSDGKELKDHYPITYQGSTWVQLKGKFYFISNRLRGDGTAQSVCYIESTKSTGIAIIANIILRNITTPQGLVLRLNSSNGYHIRVAYSGTKFELLEVSNSTASRANFPESITFDQAYRFKILLEGPKITLLVNGTQKLTWTTAFNQDQTKHGLYPSSSTTTQFEDFEVIQL